MTHRRRTESRRPHGPRRAAFTLTEMMIVISLIAMISTGAAVLIGSLMKLDGDTGAAVVEQLARSRFRQRFCADVHSATSATITTTDAAGQEDDAHSNLTLFLMNGQTADYEITPDAVELVVRQDGVVRLRELYRLPGEKAFSHAGDQGIVSFTQSVVEVSSTDADELQDLPGLELRIDAALGWDHRHTAAGGSDE